VSSAAVGVRAGAVGGVGVVGLDGDAIDEAVAVVGGAGEIGAVEGVARGVLLLHAHATTRNDAIAIPARIRAAFGEMRIERRVFLFWLPSSS
jgi:hypothetical protein